MEKTIIVVLMCIMLCMGCVSTNGRTDESILAYQRRVSELEATNSDLSNRLAKYNALIADSVQRLNAIGAAAAEAGTTVDRIISLFGQYQSEVERLVRSYTATSMAGATTQ